MMAGKMQQSMEHHAANFSAVWPAPRPGLTKDYCRRYHDLALAVITERKDISRTELVKELPIQSPAFFGGDRNNTDSLKSSPPIGFRS